METRHNIFEASSLETRHYQFLIDLYEARYTNKLHLYFDKHKLGVFGSMILVEMGLVKVIKNGKKKEIIWIANKPTVRVAVDLVKKIRLNQKEYKHKYNNRITPTKQRLYNNLPNKFFLKEGLKITRELGLSQTTFFNLMKCKKNNKDLFIKNNNKYFKITAKEQTTKEWYTIEGNNNKLNDIEALDDFKKDIDQEEITITPEIKSKHISLFWGLFKYEIKK
tara:strand:+ start:999 stop:1664 length:666 start_codon:yes stop_codon:yes gene_type:complete